ncbi:MAG: tetratricopeptide repeat protein [Chloroflexi bacterium]|nr:tetratricopeptide repeat protein [Chloroflexota bacterium]
MSRQIITVVAPRMEQLGYREEWIHCLESCVVWARAGEDTAAEAQILRTLGRLHRLMDRYAVAESWLEQSVAASRLSGDARDVATALNQLGRVYHLQYRYEDALACAAEALTCLGADDAERAESHYVLGMVALGQRRWAEAEIQHKLALDFRLRAGDQRTIAWSYQNLGLVCLRQSEYGKQNRLPEANEWLRQAVDRLESLSDPYHLAVAQTNLGAVQERLGNYQESIRLYQQASASLRFLGAQRPLAQTYNNLGLIYLRLTEPERAEDAFRDGVAIYVDIGDHQSRLNTQHGVVLALLQQHRFAEAAELCERSLAEIESLQSFPEEYAEKRAWYSDSLQKARQGAA